MSCDFGRTIKQLGKTPVYQVSFSDTVYNESYEGFFFFQNWGHLDFRIPVTTDSIAQNDILRELDITSFFVEKGFSLTFYSFKITAKHDFLSRKIFFLTITSLPWQRVM